ncbi:MAG TPA: 50S ribosomal protein L25 [Candidatus Eisenbacteria bacterium]|nr:50S ribosomal protein L25 [Candidatus Eisenbacteria bacterium]
MAMQALKGARRSGIGKGVARKLRQTGSIPAVYYGRGEEPIVLTVVVKELEEVILKAEGSNVIVDLKVDGDGVGDRKALIREIQRDPVGGHILHLDLQHISLTETIVVEVPIILTGVPTGVKDGGGILEHLLREVEVECLPTDIPSRLEIDVSALNIGDSLHVSDLKADKVTILTEGERSIAAVVPPTVLEEAKPAEEGATAAEPELVKEKKETEEGKEG